MKKYSLIAAVASAMLLTGCFHKSNDSKPSTEQKPSETSEQSKENKTATEEKGESTSTNEEAEVKKITMPIEQYEELSKEEITSLLQEEGVKNIQFSKENTVVYEVPKKQYDEKKNTLQAELKDMITAIQQKDQYPSIKAVEVSKDFTHYQLTVDKEKFEDSFDSLAVLSLAMSTLYYFSYVGDLAATIKVDYIDMNSKELYKSQTYPEPVQQ